MELFSWFPFQTPKRYPQTFPAGLKGHFFLHTQTVKKAHAHSVPLSLFFCGGAETPGAGKPVSSEFRTSRRSMPLPRAAEPSVQVFSRPPASRASIGESSRSWRVAGDVGRREPLPSENKTATGCGCFEGKSKLKLCD